MALIDDAKHPTPARAPLIDNPLRVYGPQRARLVPCAVKPKTHDAHPEDEACAYCEPGQAAPGEPFHALWDWTQDWTSMWP